MRALTPLVKGLLETAARTDLGAISRARRGGVVRKHLSASLNGPWALQPRQ